MYRKIVFGFFLSAVFGNLSFADLKFDAKLCYVGENVLNSERMIRSEVVLIQDAQKQMEENIARHFQQRGEPTQTQRNLLEIKRRTLQGAIDLRTEVLKHFPGWSETIEATWNAYPKIYYYCSVYAHPENALYLDRITELKGNSYETSRIAGVIRNCIFQANSLEQLNACPSINPAEDEWMKNGGKIPLVPVSN
jgi:hypothetical protein